MGILEAYAVPHPPIIIPGVGRGEERDAQKTLDAFAAVAQRIAKLKPELIVFSTPHGNLYHDALSITTGTTVWGDLAEFRAASEKLSLNLDEAFIALLIDEAKREGIAVVARPEPQNKLDHGCMVPLLLIAPHLEPGYKIVRIGTSFLDEQSHYRMGQCVARAVEATGRRAVYIASGDLSHRLKESGPYGFNPAGPRFDEQITQAFAAGDLVTLMHLDKQLCENAAECGLNSFIMMAGALNDTAFDSELLSYESPWGVGYGVARFTPLSQGAAPQNNALAPGSLSTCSKSCSFPVRLAFAALADRLAGHKSPSTETPQVAALLSELNASDRISYEELCSRQAGAFVSFHKNDDLRGCIGTVAASCDTLFEEICQNTVSAAFQDPRFPAIRTDELALLSCSVDVLGDAEPVADRSTLDAKRYGVIVTKGFRRGLLLPDLEGVDTPEQQIAIALSKASIAPHAAYELERFEVIRFT